MASPFGYRFSPSKYSPPIGYSGLEIWISTHDRGGYFDVKYLDLPTYEGSLFRLRQISRHGEESSALHVCPGEIKLLSHKGDEIHGFTFGGTLSLSTENDYRKCVLNSTAPILRFGDDPTSAGAILVDEIIDLISEAEVKWGSKEGQFYEKMANLPPYDVFLGSLISLQAQADSVPSSLRTEKYRKVVSTLKKCIQTVKQVDGWDGTAQSLSELLSKSA